MALRWSLVRDRVARLVDEERACFGLGLRRLLRNNLNSNPGLLLRERGIFFFELDGLSGAFLLAADVGLLVAWGRDHVVFRAGSRREAFTLLVRPGQMRSH